MDIQAIYSTHINIMDLAILLNTPLRIREIPVSNFGSESGYPD
jgi:hypothetical protein